MLPVSVYHQFALSACSRETVTFEALPPLTVTEEESAKFHMIFCATLEYNALFVSPVT